MDRRLVPLSLLLLSLPLAAAAQQQQHEQHEKEEADSSEHPRSGTSLEPRSAPLPGWQGSVRGWRLMFHGSVFLVETHQSGPQGRDKFFSTNWMMLSVDGPVGRGRLALRTMLSLEPATITRRHYPLLFQTGETAFGAPLINGQHPHEFVMELAAQYTHPLSESLRLVFYGGPVGDPALGPVAFPHRTSAAELPEAPLSHHLQDSTHIAASVFTLGLAHRWFQLEASSFHGREPDEERWGIELGMPDSLAARLTLRPGSNWALQVSHGRLNEPEAAERGDIDRTTASLAYHRPFPTGHWATTLVWGRNHKRPARGNLNSYLLESSLRFLDRNYLFGRWENVDREGLFLTGDPESEPVTRVTALTLGLARDLLTPDSFRLALGFDLSFYAIPAVLHPIYSSHPVGARFFLRLRLGHTAEH